MAQIAQLKTDDPHRYAKERFIESFAQCGRVDKSCEFAGVPRRTIYNWRDKDDQFRQAWDEAEYVSNSVLEDEGMRRAIDGVDRPVYQNGELVGTVKEYSDTLLIFLLKGRNPAKYRDNHRVEITGANGESIKVENTTEEKRMQLLLEMARQRGALALPDHQEPINVETIQEPAENKTE